MEEITVPWPEEVMQAIPAEILGQLRSGVVDDEVLLACTPTVEIRVAILEYDGCSVKFQIVGERSGYCLVPQTVTVRWKVVRYRLDFSSSDEVGLGKTTLSFAFGETRDSRTIGLWTDDAFAGRSGTSTVPCHWKVKLWIDNPLRPLEVKWIIFRSKPV